MKQQEEEKTYVVNVEEENIALKKKIISMEKDYNALNTKVDEMRMELEGKLKERQREISLRMEMKARVDLEKSTLSKENSLSVEEVDAYVKEKELSMLKKTVDKNKKLSKYTSYYCELLSKVEDSIHEMVEKKPELKSQISVFSSEVTKLLKAITEEQQRESKLVSDIVKSDSKSRYVQENIPEL